ncbi:hypothetical protein WDR79_004854 [Citrobacter freundii]
MKQWFASYTVYNEEDEQVVRGTIIREYEDSVNGEEALTFMDDELCKEHGFNPINVHYVAFNRI